MRDAELGAPATGHLGRLTSSDRRLLARSSLTFASRAFTRLSGAVLVVALARLLTLDEFAAYAYLIALIALVVVAGDTGVGLLASRDVAAGRAEPGAAFWSATPIVLGAAALSAGLLAAFAAVFSGPTPRASAIVLAAAVVAGRSLFVFAAGMLRGLGRLELEAALQLGGAVAFVLGAVAAAAAGLGVAGVLAVLLAKDVASSAVALALLGRDVRPASRPARVLRLLARGLRIGVATTGLAVATQTPLLLLANTAPADEVARFAAPFRLADAALFLAVAAGVALLPGLAHVGETERARALRLVRRAILVAFTASAAASAALVPLAGVVVTLLFGARFEEAAGPARFLLGGLPVYAVVGLAWYALIALGREGFVLRASLAGATASVLASAFLVPAYGGAGAAAAYVGVLTLVAVGIAARLLREPS
jgi:O-antigen/teichoic acid export membrane protein